MLTTVADRGSARPNGANTSSSWQVGGPRPVAGVQIWAKPLGPGKTAALFINGGGSPYSASISLTELNVTGVFASDVDLGLTTRGNASSTTGTSTPPGGASVKVTDVWTGEDAGPITSGNWSTGVVKSMDSRFVVFEASSSSSS